MADAPYSLDIAAGAQAFGDASHPSTQGALAALDALSHLHGVKNALDMGCGSGILALKMAYQWHVPVVAADNQREAVQATAQNAATNQLQDLITPCHSHGFAHEVIRAHAPYDVITANILADILVQQAADLALHLADEGVAVLSGMLVWQCEPVLAAYQAQGLSLLQKLTLNDWVTLILQKN